jgi:hypothetical protein
MGLIRSDVLNQKIIVFALSGLIRLYPRLKEGFDLLMGRRLTLKEHDLALNQKLCP